MAWRHVSTCVGSFLARDDVGACAQLDDEVHLNDCKGSGGGHGKGGRQHRNCEATDWRCTVTLQGLSSTCSPFLLYPDICRRWPLLPFFFIFVALNSVFA